MIKFNEREGKVESGECTDILGLYGNLAYESFWLYMVWKVDTLRKNTSELGFQPFSGLVIYRKSHSCENEC